jgi:hypothetical protein
MAGPLAAIGGPWALGLWGAGQFFNWMGNRDIAKQNAINTAAELQGAANLKESEVNLSRDRWKANRGLELARIFDKDRIETDDFNRSMKFAGRYIDDFAPKMGNFQRQENIKNAINSLNPTMQEAARQQAGLNAAQMSYTDALNYAAKQGKGGSYQLDKLNLKLGLGPRFT